MVSYLNINPKVPVLKPLFETVVWWGRGNSTSHFPSQTPLFFSLPRQRREAPDQTKHQGIKRLAKLAEPFNQALAILSAFNMVKCWKNASWNCDIDIQIQNLLNVSLKFKLHKGPFTNDVS